MPHCSCYPNEYQFNIRVFYIINDNVYTERTALKRVGTVVSKHASVRRTSTYLTDLIDSIYDFVRRQIIVLKQNNNIYEFEMNNEQLIEFVRKHVELYDSSHAKYRDGNYKEKVWKEISENIKQPITACKRRWNNMRDNYRKSRKRRITKSEQDGQFKIIRYKYEDQLRFLDPFLKDRNNSIITSESNEVLSEQASPVERADVNDDNNDKNETITAARTDILEITESKSLKSRHKKPLSSASRRKSKRVKSEIASPQSTVSDTASSTLVKYILEKNDSKNVAEASHPVDTFLSGIAPTLKSLNSYYLNITKTKIFTIVQEAEMTQIMEQRTQCRMRNARSGTEQQRYSSNSEYSRTPSPRFMHVTLQSPSPESYDSHPRS